MTYILALDQGTTSSRAIIFNQEAKLMAVHQIDLQQTFPQDGWVEQDAEEIWQTSLTCCQQVLKKINLSANDIAAMGITNQRETTIIWDKYTGIPIYPAIVWQDRRTANECEALRKTSLNKIIQEKTGLLLDPYFSATKIIWILENVPDAYAKTERGELLFGTVDTFLLWKFTKRRSHFTDVTNASRTLLFDLEKHQWDDEILNALNIPKNILPKILNTVADFGKVDKSFLGSEIQIGSMIGDQQAATVGQACFEVGMVKATYGTGAFMVLNTGNKIVNSKNNLLSTIIFKIADQTIYGLEGSVFSAGTIIKWLRDTLKIIQHAADTSSLAATIESTDGVYLVPAFTGLGAPYWNPDARAALLGLKSNSGIAHIARAALEAVCYQTRDLFECMLNDANLSLDVLRVDGAMSANNWMLQFLSDILHVSIQRPICIESSALGAACLAGLQVNLFSSLNEISSLYKTEAIFKPTMSGEHMQPLYNGWKKAVEKIMIPS